jgi:hypothetical protein
MKTMKILKSSIIAIAISCMVFLGSCKKDKDSKEAEKRNVEVRMTDAPASFASLTLDVKAVEIFIEGEGWTRLSSSTKSFNVLSLCNGKFISLGHNTEFEAGNYRTYGESDLGIINFDITTQVQANWEGPKIIEVDLSSNIQASGNLVIMLDFDVAKSVIKSGGAYLVKPVINYVKNPETGIQGTITGAASAYITIQGDNFNASTNMDADGQFKIVGASAGTYTLIIDYYISGQSATEAPKKKVIENVIIVEGEIKQQGEIQCN